MGASLPPPRTPGPYRLTMVCLGNICRSPTAAIVLAAKLDTAGLGPQVVVDSAGTGDWHLGDPINPQAAAVLGEAGYDYGHHRSRQIDSGWFEDRDALLVMDHQNHHDVSALAPAPDRDRIRYFREFDPAARGQLDLPDPWSGPLSGYIEVLAIVERTTDVLVGRLRDLVG